MKTVTILSLLLLLAAPVFGELTKEDLRTVVKEENAALEKRLREYIDLKIDGVEKSLNARIDGVEKSLNARIDALDEKIDSVEKNLSDKIDGVEKNLNARIGNMWLMMIGLIGLITGAIAIPQMIAARRERSQKDMQSQIDQLREQIEALQTPSS